MPHSSATPRLEDLAFPPAAQHLDVVVLLKEATEGAGVRFRDVLPLFNGSVEDAADVLADLEDWKFILPSSGDFDGDDTGEAYLAEPIELTPAARALVERITVTREANGQRRIEFPGSDGTLFTIVSSADGAVSALLVDEEGDEE